MVNWYLVCLGMFFKILDERPGPPYMEYFFPGLESARGENPSIMDRSIERHLWNITVFH